MRATASYIGAGIIPGEGGGVTPTLNPLTVTPNTATVGTVFNGAVSSRTAGSTLALTGSGAAGLSINSGTGAITGTPTSSGAVNVVETLSGAIGSPRTSNGVVAVQEGIIAVANNTRLTAINSSYVSNISAATAANLKSAQNGITVQNVLVAASSTGYIGHEFAAIPEGAALYISQGGNYVANLLFSTDSTDYVNGTWTTVPVVMKHPSRLSSATRNGDCSQLVDLPAYNVPVKVKLAFTNQAASSSYFSAVWYATTPDTWMVLGPSLPNAASAPRSMRDLMASAVPGSDPITLNYTVIGLSGVQVAETINEFISAYPRVKNAYIDIGGNDVTGNRPYAADVDPTLMKRSYDAGIAACKAAGKRPFGGYITYRNYPTAPAVNGLTNRGNGSRDYNNLTLATSIKTAVPEVWNNELGIDRLALYDRFLYTRDTTLAADGIHFANGSQYGVYRQAMVDLYAYAKTLTWPKPYTVQVIEGLETAGSLTAAQKASLLAILEDWPTVDNSSQTASRNALAARINAVAVSG